MSDHVLRIACPRWHEDGPWPPPWDHACVHTRLEISLPISAQTMSALVAAVGTCECKRPMVILFPDVVSEDEVVPPSDVRRATDQDQYAEHGGTAGGKLRSIAFRLQEIAQSFGGTADVAALLQIADRIPPELPWRN